MNAVNAAGRRKLLFQANKRKSGSRCFQLFEGWHIPYYRRIDFCTSPFQLKETGVPKSLISFKERLISRSSGYSVLLMGRYPERMAFCLEESLNEVKDLPREAFMSSEQ